MPHRDGEETHWSSEDTKVAQSGDCKDSLGRAQGVPIVQGVHILDLILRPSNLITCLKKNSLAARSRRKGRAGDQDREDTLWAVA